MSDRSTIFALSSGQGAAGVAVIRISGELAFAAAAALAGPMPRRRAMRLRAIYGPGGPIDQALVLTFPSPASFTGEDVVELHVHGGRAVVAAVLEALARQPGLRPAEPGEFTRRAFEHGRIDLTEAEGLADLVAAETEAQRRQALAQTSGALRHLYDGWRSEIIKALALIEAELDFSDEADVPESAGAGAWSVIEQLAARIRDHLDDGHRGEILRDGFRVVIAGPPNAGKSSLMNALARREVAIVSEEAGTTRDVITVRLDLGGYPVVVSDTAGIREAPGAIEREGVRRALAEAGSADLVLWLIDPLAPLTNPPSEVAAVGGKARIVRVLSKSDLAIAPNTAEAVSSEVDLAVSAKTGSGLPELIRAVMDAAAQRIGDVEAGAITRARHRTGLEATVAALGDALAADRSRPELAAEDLRRAAHALGRITGRVDVEDVLDAIFAGFCIGK